MTRATATWIAVLLFGAVALPVQAEQFQTINGYDVHYIVVPTLSLDPEIAASYDLIRSKTHSLINISILDATGAAAAASVAGTATNLLGQLQTLQFEEVREGPAIYYLALVRHTDEETFRFNLDLSWPGGETGQLRWSQQLYWQR